MKLGDHRIVLRKSVDHATDTDDYGNPVRGYVYLEVPWCSVTPARASEDYTRNSPAISGATLLAPPRYFRDVQSADAVLWPYQAQPDGTYTGRTWEVLGEVGQWDEAVECQLRRLT